MASNFVYRDVQENELLEPFKTLKDFEYQFMTWVMSTSGTVRNGQYLNHHAGSDRQKPSLGMSGAALKAKAEANMRHHIVHVVARAAIDRWNVSRFMAVVPHWIHFGIPYAKTARSLRCHETGRAYGCPPSQVPEAWERFRERLRILLDEGLQDPERVDPWLIVAAAEWYLRFGIHPLSDGCGRLSTATSFWIMLLFQEHPPFPVFERTGLHESMRLGVVPFMELFLHNCFPMKRRERPEGPIRDPFAGLLPEAITAP